MSKIERSPKVGDIAPNFTLPSTPNDEFQLANLKGNGIVLFFYPKDNTPGCTQEAISFTQHLASFTKLGVQVIGLSPDTIKKHNNFIDKHSLEVILVSDEEKTTLEDYAVWVEKSMYGRTYMGVERSTFLIDKEGVIVKAWRKVKVAGHVEEVLDAAKELLS